MPTPKRTDKMINEIMLRISDGDSLNAICKDEHIVSRKTFYQWLDDDQVLGDKYARAREEQGDYYALRVNETAERALTDEIRPDQARVAIDAFKWTAGKLNGKYADRTINDNNNRNLNTEVPIDQIPEAELMKIAKQKPE